MRVRPPLGQFYRIMYIYSIRDVSCVSDVFAVLADPTRRHLIHILHGGERSVGELVERVDIEQPGVSRHLRILHDAGLVRIRPDGQRRFYALRREPFQDLDRWVKQYCEAVEGRLDRLGDLVEPKKPKVKP